MMRPVVLAVLLLGSVCGPASAQTRMLMPEGTYDMVLGIAYGTSFNARSEGGTRSIVVPSGSIEWSNGVFVEAGVDDATLGLHLSDNPFLDYGILASVTARDQRTDTPGERGSVSVQAGGFVSWQPIHSMQVGATVFAGGGFDGGGVLGHVHTNYAKRLAAHHGLGLGAGMLVADHRWMQGYFGVTPAQAASGGTPVYRASAGVVSVYGDVDWRWQVSNKYWLTTGARLSRLAGPAAASPLVGSRMRPSVRIGLTYHF